MEKRGVWEVGMSEFSKGVEGNREGSIGAGTGIGERSNLLSVEEAAKYLNLKVSKVRSMIFRKELPLIKIGRLVRFHEEDLKIWVLNKRNLETRFSPSHHAKNNPLFFEIDTRFSKANFKGVSHD